MEIQINNADELNTLLDELSVEIVDANIYHRLYNSLVESIQDYADAFAQSNTFWRFTLDALNDAVLVRLCRVFDQESNSLNLYNLLETIRANIHYFEENHFRERLKGSPFVSSLAEDSRIPDKSQLDDDIRFVSKHNPAVQKLIIWRNNIIAH